jgi:hypothetical protein
MEFAVSSGKGKTVSPIEANDSYLTLKLVEVGRDQSTRFLPTIRAALISAQAELGSTNQFWTYS